MAGGGEGGGCADDRHMKFVVTAEVHKLFLKYRVRKMGAVPSQQVVHLMEDRERDVGGVHCRLRRKLEELRDVLGEFFGLGRYREARDALEPINRLAAATASPREASSIVKIDV